MLDTGSAGCEPANPPLKLTVRFAARRLNGLYVIRPMYLDVGNRERIDNPTPEQIRYHLRHLPPDAPFLILDADYEHFIQATPAGDAFRVEWRQEGQQRFMLVPLDRAEQSFLAFRRWDEAALQAFPWHRLSVFNDPYRRLVMVALVLLAIALVGLCSALR